MTEPHGGADPTVFRTAAVQVPTHPLCMTYPVLTSRAATAPTATAARTAAAQDPATQEWVIDGQKLWSSSAKCVRGAVPRAAHAARHKNAQRVACFRTRSPRADSHRARYAAFFIIMAVTDPGAAKHSSMSMFLVPAETAGVEV
jgi:alkylation response protein AidB-like acyl-CoA dehydrogenase